MSQSQTIHGVGRLHRGHRSLGCVGYTLKANGAAALVRFDPMPDAVEGDVLHLTLEDGRVLECQVLSEYATCCAVVDGPRAERRMHRRPATASRSLL